MKNKIFLFVLAAVMLPALSFAAKWRISNVPNADAHFTTIAAAVSSTMVMAGDTLYIEPSSVAYPTATITKPLTIIGNGYFLAENPETKSNKNVSAIGSLTFDPGGSGSVLTGCWVNGVSISAGTTQIRIERNRITSQIYFFGGSNIVITGNYITHELNWQAITSNIIVSNNFIQATATTAITGNVWPSAIFENNIISGNVAITNSVFNNNILRSGTFTQTNSTFSNNLSNDNQFGTANGNQQYINMANVFVGTGSTDGQWQLKPGSPAIGAGVSGVDCGMFGGATPYILSGIPPGPAIYEYLQHYNPNSQDIQVKISVKSNQ